MIVVMAGWLVGWLVGCLGKSLFFKRFSLFPTHHHIILRCQSIIITFPSCGKQERAATYNTYITYRIGQRSDKAD
jgi:hypothetical protein